MPTAVKMSDDLVIKAKIKSKIFKRSIAIYSRNSHCKRAN